MSNRYRLIKEYPGSPNLGSIKDSENYIPAMEHMKDYPEFWQPVVEKDYEILEIKGKYGAISSYIEELDHNLEDQTIFKVKRISDSEIFTIGDKVFSEYVNYTINKIDIVNDKCMVSALYDTNNPNGSRLHYNLNNLKKVKKPLFTTEDGVDIFEGDIFYSTRKDCSGCIIKYEGNLFEIASTKCKEFVDFSTKEKAEEYILLNKPCLSLNDIDELLCKNTSSYFLEKFKKLVQQKLKS